MLRVDDDAGGSAAWPRSARPKGSQPRWPAPSSDMFFRAASAVMATSPDVIEVDVLQALLARHYALDGRIEVLSSELEDSRGTLRRSLLRD
ncbi:hypothetical protein [Bradyrhizobium sp. ORS 285]|uniref:hypothetical protein n=1 Tax=Bradyrhizobium sp. ORS 285 TaxID=115808 RepID=UPI0002D73565|nr:hypothetical protein [Bradyrhizobium sp. ORS 285]